MYVDGINLALISERHVDRVGGLLESLPRLWTPTCIWTSQVPFHALTTNQRDELWTYLVEMYVCLHTVVDHIGECTVCMTLYGESIIKIKYFCKKFLDDKRWLDRWLSIEPFNVCMQTCDYAWTSCRQL